MSNCNRNQSNPWFLLFGVIATAIGCMWFGRMIEQSSSIPFVKEFGASVMAIGISIMLIIILAALVVFGIFYLLNRYRRPKYPNY